MASSARMILNISNYGWFNGTEIANSDIKLDPSLSISAGFTLVVSLVGINANFLVFWYLVFNIRRTRYTDYIINLTIANLICLLLVTIAMSLAIIYFEGQIEISYPIKVIFALDVIRGLGIYGVAFFLTIISIEKYMSIAWPTWYRWNFPRNPSFLVCIPIWSLALLVSLVDNFGCPPEHYGMVTHMCTAVQVFLLIGIVFICLPLMIMSSIVAYIRIQRSSRDTQSSRFATVILASVVVAFLTIASMQLMEVLVYFHALPHSFSTGALFFTMYMFLSLNCTFNPLIYLLVGNQNIQESREGFILASLRNVFEEEEE